MQTALTWIFIGVVSLPFLFFAVAGFQLWTRLTPLRRLRGIDGDRSGKAPPAGSDDFLEAVGPHLGVRFDPGHDLELFYCGDEIYPRLFADLAAAEHLITWHVFWFKPGELADRVKEALMERARAGVRVLFLHDWFGSLGVEKSYFRELRRAGVTVQAFRRPGLSDLYKAQQRSHVRTVVIDGRIGYTGGFAVSDEWLGEGKSPGQWRDTSVRIVGPAVHSLQVAFAADWVESTGELLTGPKLFPQSRGGFPDRRNGAGAASSFDTSSSAPEAGAGAEAAGRAGAGPHAAVALARRPGPPSAPSPPSPDRHFTDAWAALFQSSPSLGGTSAERLFALSIGGARERLWISSAYFVPNRAFRRQLVQAVRRGVDVRVLHPGGNSDRRPTWYVLRRHYDELLEGGVRIWEYEPTMMHAKTLVADDTWCAVGTVNFDNRSMALNDEVSLLVRDERVAAALAARFEDDLTRSREISLEEHRRRSAWERVQETVWSPFEPLLCAAATGVPAAPRERTGTAARGAAPRRRRAPRPASRPSPDSSSAWRRGWGCWMT